MTRTAQVVSSPRTSQGTLANGPVVQANRHVLTCGLRPMRFALTRSTSQQMMTSTLRVARFPLSIFARLEVMAVKPGPGRPGKGPRDQFSVRPVPALGNVIRRNAEHLGMTYGEYCTAILANALGMPEYAPQPPQLDEQQELPLKTA
jgi:hypothetical protein